MVAVLTVFFLAVVYTTTILFNPRDSSPLDTDRAFFLRLSIILRSADPSEILFRQSSLCDGDPEIKAV